MFETLEELYERIFRAMKPRGPAPVFSVAFFPYANIDSKIRLERGHRKVEVRMSDQLEHAPRTVHESLAFVLLGKLYGTPAPEEHLRKYNDYVNRADIRRRALEIRRERGRKRFAPPQGGRYDLEALFCELNDRYFAGALGRPQLGWSRRPSRRLLGHYDPAHHAIVVSSALDSPEVPRYVVEYVLFHEMLHIKHPVEQRVERRCVHTPEFKREEQRFPRYADANRFLARL